MRPQQKRQAFLEKAIERYGQDCFDTMSLNDIKRCVINIFKDIAYGNMDVSKYEKQLMNQRFLNTSYEEIFGIAEKHSIHLYAMNSIIINNENNSVIKLDEKFSRVYQEDKMKCEVYNRILGCLYNVKTTNNFSYFIPLFGLLNNPRELRYAI